MTLQETPEEKQPLLSAPPPSAKSGGVGGGGGKWSSYQYLGRTGSVVDRSAAVAGTEVSVAEIRSSATIVYPAVDADTSDQAAAYGGGYGGNLGGTPHHLQREILDEVEIRELLIDHIGHRCCWGSRPARTWKINSVEDCNVYVGTLDTFTETREIIREQVPYLGGKLDGKGSRPELGIWELDLRDQFPVLFIPEKETQVKVPHSEAIEKCTGCEGKGKIVCPTCNVNEEPGIYKENQMTQCPACHGRGLIAHRDGSDSICVRCNGKGKVPCPTCSSVGLIKCETCQGSGSLLSRSVAIVKWKTFTVRRVLSTSGAASVPDEVFHRARGVQLCNTQAYQCTPAFFADSYFLNKFSSEVLAERAPIPPTAKVICERHIISVVPVTRVTMAHRNRSFSFYIIGFSRDVYLKDYPAKFCWGLCPCLEWLKL
ncbi:hypothetical protein Droror1_Dr00004564 [Drosera rotundifolia]